MAELRGHGHDLDAEVVLDGLRPVPEARTARPDGHLGALEVLLVPVELGLPLGVLGRDQGLAVLLDAEEGADLADAFGHVVEAP